MDESRLMTSKEVAALLSVSEATLCRWRQRRDGGPIPAVWLCGVPRYRAADVHAVLMGTAA